MSLAHGLARRAAGLTTGDPTDPAPVRHLRHLLPAVLAAVGRGDELADALPGGAADPETLRSALEIPRTARAVVVLVDGLGAENLAARAGHAPFLRALLQRSPADPLTGLPSLVTCAPSTTAAAITTLGTGLLPGATGMVGYEVRDPGTGRATSLISWEGASMTPRGVQREPTVPQRLGGHRLVAVAPAAFAGTGLTEAALRGWTQHSAELLPARVDRALAALRRDEADVVYLYWGDLDHAGHGAGWESEAWVGELEHLDAELGRLARGLARLPGDVALVVTADHGMIDVERRHDVTRIPELREGVTVVAGDQHAPQLHLSPEPGRPAPEELAREVVARWRGYFEGQGVESLVLTRAEAATDGPLGPLGESATALLGDVLVFLGGRDVVVDPRSQSASYVSMRGVHGSLTAPELTVPLLVSVP